MCAKNRLSKYARQSAQTLIHNQLNQIQTISNVMNRRVFKLTVVIEVPRNMTLGWLPSIHFVVKVSTIGAGAVSAESQAVARLLARHASAALDCVLEEGGGRNLMAQVVENRQELQTHRDIQVVIDWRMFIGCEGRITFTYIF